jgi:DNA adenine methylase
MNSAGRARGGLTTLPDLGLPSPPSRQRAYPFLKWAGGKGLLLNRLSRVFPKTFGTYFEPFLGGGAVFFSLRPPSAVLSDSNTDLINAYKVVQRDVEPLIVALRELETRYRRAPKTTFRQAREAYLPSTAEGVDQAALFIFLNRTCYNGLYRVNQSGKFNVPFGQYSNPTICDAKGLRLARAALSGAVLRNVDYADALGIVEGGDFVYLDPPYHPISKTANFVNYTSSAFGKQQHVELALELARLNTSTGCKILVSSSNVSEIERTYTNLGFKIDYVTAPRRISCKAETRGRVRELLIRNFEAT